MVDAATPDPEKKEEATPPTESATPAEKPKEESTPSSSAQDTKTVAELEAEVVRLNQEVERQSAHASTANKIAKGEKKLRIAAELKFKGSTSGEGLEEEDLNPPTPTGELQELRLGVQDLLLGTPEYLKVLELDQTLKEVLRKNPTVLIGDYLDAEDAVEQVKAVLDKRIVQMKEAEKAAKKPDKKEEGKEFDVPSQPAEGTPPKEEKKELEASNNLDIRLEESIKSKIKVE